MAMKSKLKERPHCYMQMHLCQFQYTLMMLVFGKEFYLN